MIEEQKNDSQLMWDWHFECSWNIFYILIQLYNLKVKKKITWWKAYFDVLFNP